jgi:NADH-quinone oxidoreductase subunit K
MTITPTHYMILAALIFCIGLAGVSIRRNALVMFMSVELMLNAANLTFVAYSKQLDDVAGQVSVFFTLVVAAAEVAVGLALIVAIFHRVHGTSPDDISLMREAREVPPTFSDKSGIEGSND